MFFYNKSPDFTSRIINESSDMYLTTFETHTKINAQ